MPILACTVFLKSKAVHEVLEMNSFTWKRVAATFDGATPQSFRNSVVLTMLIGFGFVWREAFKQFFREPFSWTQGDVEAAIDEFARIFESSPGCCHEGAGINSA